MRAEHIRISKSPRLERGDDWREHAACRDYNPEDWFPDFGDNATRNFAKTVCRQDCAVSTQCLAAAIRNEEQHGVWAGINFGDARARRKVLREADDAA